MVGIIAVLLAILLPSLSVVRGNAVLGQSLNHLRQVGQYMEAYSKDNRETVVPSRVRLQRPGEPREGPQQQEVGRHGAAAAGRAPPQGDLG